MDPLAVVVIAALLFGLWLERHESASDRGRNAQERDDLLAAHDRTVGHLLAAAENTQAVHATQLAEALAANEREREHWYRERTLLLNRIQPQTAQPIVGPVDSEPLQAVSIEDDDDYWMAQGMSKEQLADAIDRAERDLAVATAATEPDLS